MKAAVASMAMEIRAKAAGILDMGNETIARFEVNMGCWGQNWVNLFMWRACLTVLWLQNDWLTDWLTGWLTGCVIDWTN